MSAGIESLISTVGTTQIMAKFGINQSYYGMVYAAMINFLDFLMNKSNLDKVGSLVSHTSILTTVIAIGWLISIGVFVYVYLYVDISRFSFKRVFQSRNKTNIKLIKINDMVRFSDYLLKGVVKKEIISLDRSIEIGTATPSSGISGGSFLLENKIYLFHDKNHDIFMEVEWVDPVKLANGNSNSNISNNLNNSNSPNNSNQTSQIPNDPERYKPYLMIGLNKSILDVTKFIEECLNFYDKQEETIRLHHSNYYFISKDNGDSCFREDCHLIYRGPKQIDKVNMHDRFIKTYFHDKIDQIWKMVEYVHFNPQSLLKLGQNPQLTMCLHGPPGTGKSTLAYRIAMATGRHVSIIDLKTMPSKSSLRNHLNSPIVDGSHRSTKDVVFVIDEFDLAIKFLKQKQDFIDVYKMRMLEKIEKEKESPDYSFDKPEEKSEKDTKKSPCAKISSMFSEISSYITINDLLEIIQGPSPYEGLIFIVTTNHFEEIYKICPALFREGRFSPVYCGPVTPKMLTDIVKVYFETTLPTDYLHTELKMPASTVVNLAMKHKFMDKGLEAFLKDLR